MALCTLDRAARGSVDTFHVIRTSRTIIDRGPASSQSDAAVIWHGQKGG